MNERVIDQMCTESLAIASEDCMSLSFAVEKSGFELIRIEVTRRVMDRRNNASVIRFVYGEET